jgi:hypothetical protein
MQPTETLLIVTTSSISSKSNSVTKPLNGSTGHSEKIHVPRIFVNMPLGALPIEILSKIFEQIAEDPDYPYRAHPLLCISLSCKLFYELAQPLLYNEVKVPYALRIDNLLRALVRRPSLAGFVKSLDSPAVQPGWKRSIEMEGNLDLSFMTEPQCEWMRRNLPDEVFGEDICDEWHQKLLSGNWDAVLGFLLLLFSPSLKQLKLWSSVPQSPYMWLVLDRAAKEQHSDSELALLSNLQEVHLLNAVSNGKGLDVSYVSPFLKLNSVTTMTISGIEDDIAQIAQTFVFGNEHISAVTKLSFFDSRATVPLFQNILPCFGSLKAFRYEHASMDRSRRMRLPEFAPAAIIRGLDASKHCLESLWLAKAARVGFGLRGQFDMFSYDRYGPVESLNGFERLR